MSLLKGALAIVLCVVGIWLILLEVGMLVSEPDAFAWFPFLLFVVIGVASFLGGSWMLLRSFSRGQGR